MLNSSSIYGKRFKEILTNEKLDPKKHDAGDYVKDFAKSKAPQFKGKSKKKKREMAIAAYLDAKDEGNEEAIKIAKMFDEAMKAGNVKKAKEIMFSMYDHDPDGYKRLYQIFRTQYPEDAEQIRKGGAGKSSYTGTRVHKDKKKESSKKLGRKKVKDEDDSSYAGGALGPAAAVGHSRSGDWYAPGDYRVPKMLGAVIQKRTSPELLATSISGKRKKRRKSKKKK